MGVDTFVGTGPDLSGKSKYGDLFSAQLADAINKVRPKIEDTGFQCTEKPLLGKDIVHPVYTFNAGPDMMEQVFTNGQLLSGTRMATPLQKALLNGIASEYLKKEGRIKDHAEIDFPQASVATPSFNREKNTIKPL